MLFADGEGVLVSSSPRRSMDCVRCVWMLSSGGMCIGSRGERVICIGGSVRSCRFSVYYISLFLFFFYFLVLLMRVEKGKHTPFTILVPTRVIVPLTFSLRCVLITSVLPGSIGARSA